MRNASGDAVQAFYAAALPEVGITNDAENISMVQDRITELDSRVRLGKSRETELFSVQSTLASVKADLAKSNGDRTAALAELGLLIGEDAIAIDVAAEAPDTMAVPSLSDALTAVQNRSDLAAARKALDEQELRVAFDKGAFLPELNVVGNYYFDRPPGAPSLWDAALSLDFPLFQGGRDRAQIRIDESQLKAEQIALDFQLRQAEADVRTAQAALAASIEQYSFLKEANDNADAAYRSLVKEYRLGLVNNLDVLAGLSTLLTAKSAYTRSAVQVRQNRALLMVTLEQL
jgi:outer membrane protein TolC